MIDLKPSIEKWIEEVKRDCDPNNVGMILIHNGIVRGSSKVEGKRVRGIRLSYDRKLLEETLKSFSQRDGIEKVKAWINEGELKTGDDIMLVLVAGRYRTDVLPTFEGLIEKIKREIVREEELLE